MTAAPEIEGPTPNDPEAMRAVLLELHRLQDGEAFSVRVVEMARDLGEEFVLIQIRDAIAVLDAAAARKAAERMEAAVAAYAECSDYAPLAMGIRECLRIMSGQGERGFATIGPAGRA